MRAADQAPVAAAPASLAPLNVTREQRFRHDLALPIPALPALSTAADFDKLDPKKHGFARTQLVRGQNRVIAALRRAEELVRAA